MIVLSVYCPNYQSSICSTQVLSLAMLLCHSQLLCDTGLVCVNTTSYVADTADGCISSTIVLTSIYASTDYFGYCLPADTTTTDWNALHAIVNTPAVSPYRCAWLKMHQFTCGRLYVHPWVNGLNQPPVRLHV